MIRTYFDVRRALMAGCAVVTLYGGVALVSQAAFFTPAYAQDKAQQPPTQVIVQMAAKRPLSDTIEALGNLRAYEDVALTPVTSQTVTAIHFEDGQRVTKGDVLVEMTSREEQAQLSEAQSTLDEAEKQLERTRPLAEKGTVSKVVLDERIRDQQTALARLEAIQSRLDNLLIRAPFDGVVGLKNISIGALIGPGDVVTTLVDDTRMKLDFSVPSVFLSDLTQGLEVEATTAAYGADVFKGTVESLDNRIDPVTRSVSVRAILPNPDGRLKAGMLMRVTLKTAPRSAFMVAEEALVQDADKTYVFVAKDAEGGQIAEKRQIKTGTREVGTVEVLDGLAEGEAIVTHGTMKLRPDAPIAVRGVDDGSVPVEEMLKPKDSSPDGGQAGNDGKAGAGQ